MEHNGELCKRAHYEQAIGYRNRLAVSHRLKASVRKRQLANGLKTLEGMALASPIWHEVSYPILGKQIQ